MISVFYFQKFLHKLHLQNASKQYNSILLLEFNLNREASLKPLESGNFNLKV